ncbi:(2Fe-2S)-binding protein [Actinoplanes siamensis]|uniref:Ferric siderophore reductase C-terminal domain-containing protein n=1 Tax=Actinoplanes siamensis TaxID=1223317 RepID=A0A919TIN4_9ACTN|nr:(2Fe-2S)-binding protein [Actinoplanes siamensis]GIF03879.1 hypothetical protein Asi03nite_14170 [Actinoplanes siamensis]
MGSVEALAAAARLGPYFAWEPWDGDAGWRPLSELLDERVVGERVRAAHDTLVRMSGLDRRAVGERAVASITFLGLASRLLSPLLAAAAVGGALPLPAFDRLWWRPAPGGPMPMAYRELAAVPCAAEPPGVVAASLAETATARLVEPVLEVFRRRFGLSPLVLRGNVASALGGACGMIADQVPEHAARAAGIVGQALLQEPLLGTAELVRPDPGRDRWFLVRRNCCLYYRIPGGGTCGDCVLTGPQERRRHWDAVLAR